MTCLAPLALLLCTVLPQNPGDEKYPTKLSAGEAKKLNSLAQDWFENRLKEDNSEGRAREAAQTKFNRARDAFYKEWELRNQKHDVLAQMGDLQAIFARVFPYPSRPATGEPESVRPKDGTPAHTVVVPRSYRNDTPSRLVVALPSRMPTGDRWVAPADFFKEAWRGSKLDTESVFLMPAGREGGDYDPVPDLTSEKDLATELDRIVEVMRTLRAGRMGLHLDTNRYILDCGRGSSAFGLRLVTYFPSLFAGVIVRHPTAIEKPIRLENLTGLPVLIVTSAETAAAGKAIADTLNGFAPDACKVIEGKGMYPFKDSATEIADWARNVRRDLFRKKVVLVPNRDELVEGYWVTLARGEAVSSTTEKNRPQFTVEADRATNRVTVTSVGVSEFRLMLNDVLVDLDKEVTIVVNGQATSLKRERSLNYVSDLVYRKVDPNFLFVTDYIGEVKAAPAATGDAEKQDAPK